MRCKSLVLALTAIGGFASAQPGPWPQPPPPMDTTDPAPPMDPVPEPEPPPPAPPPAPEPQPVVAQQTVVEEPMDDTRPSYVAIGLGLGYARPIALDMPNISSLRLRLPSGLTFEPAVRLSNTSSDGETSDKLTVFALNALIRLPVVSHGKVDLEVLGSAGFATSKSNPEGDYNSTTNNIFQLGYGVAVSYWITRHFNFSMSITNPLLDYRQTKQQAGVPNMSSKSSDTTIGIIFDPAVFMMLHLYN